MHSKITKVVTCLILMFLFLAGHEVLAGALILALIIDSRAGNRAQRLQDLLIEVEKSLDGAWGEIEDLQQDVRDILREQDRQDHDPTPGCNCANCAIAGMDELLSEEQHHPTLHLEEQVRDLRDELRLALDTIGQLQERQEQLLSWVQEQQAETETVPEMVGRVSAGLGRRRCVGYGCKCRRCIGHG